MSAADTLRAEAAKRVLVKDGAYGTMIQAERLGEQTGAVTNARVKRTPSAARRSMCGVRIVVSP